MHKTNIYLDIDGVLLANEEYPANGASDLIKHLVENYPVYWLTTHCMHGDTNEPIEHIGHLFDELTVNYMRQIRPTSWSFLKTEAIDFDKPFIWLDDDLYDEETKVLEQHNVLSSWVEVDLRANNNKLIDLLNDLPIPHTTL